jgi:hypothetical protein
METPDVGVPVVKRRGKTECHYSGTFVTTFAVNVPKLKNVSDFDEHTTLSLFYYYFLSCYACLGATTIGVNPKLKVD